MDSNRPKKNKIYLRHHYRDAKEQTMDMLFWNEKFLNELFNYSRLDDGIPRILEIVAHYKEKLKDHNISEEEYYSYVKGKLEKIKEIISINEKWSCLETTGIDDFEQLVELDQDKKRINKLTAELGTFRELIK